jgi:predicted nucleic acid-binding protein
VETHALLIARAGRTAALAWLERIPAEILPVTSVDEREALAILRRHRDKDYTLVDAASFAVMERLEVRHYHSYDRHFRQIGRFIDAGAALRLRHG